MQTLYSAKLFAPVPVTSPMPPRPRFDRRAPVRELPNINDWINYPQLRVVDQTAPGAGR